MTAEEIVKYLEEHGGGTVKEIGTDNATIYKLEKASVVRRNGFGTNPGRGRPPVIWVLANAENVGEVSAPKPRHSPEHIAAMQEGRVKAAQKRAKEEAKEKRDRLRELKASLPAAQKKYEKSLSACRKAKTEEEIQEVFDISDRHMNTVISTINQIRNLEAA